MGLGFRVWGLGFRVRKGLGLFSERVWVWVWLAGLQGMRGLKAGLGNLCHQTWSNICSVPAIAAQVGCLLAAVDQLLGLGVLEILRKDPLAS